MEQSEIKKLIEEFRITFLGEKWIWRKGQKETIIEIIKTYFEEKYDTVICDCPTGSGKSIIAMCSAWIFNKINKKCYILASDISLQEQYELDFKKFNLNWGSIKGINNYICIDNMENNSIGTCRIRNLQAKLMSCYNECPYYSARDLASKSPTSLLNYAYWLIHQNYINFIIEKPLFPPKQVLFADESHKILDIIQSTYSPIFDNKTIEKMNKLTHFFKVNKVNNHDKDFIEIKDIIRRLWIEENQDELWNLLSQIQIILKSYLDSADRLKDRVKLDYPKEKPPREWREALYISDWLTDLEYKVNDYVKIIEQTSTRNLVKNPQGEDTLTFNCLQESYLMHKYFHRWTGFRVFMSATFADPSDYLRSIALKGAKYIKVESNFSFEKSPIYYYNSHKMSYSKIENNISWMYEKINSIIDKHKNENGIIHTASYDLTLKIYAHIAKKYQKRILVYNGTEEKRKVLDQLKIGKNKILMGPSLTSGLNLKNDFARFAVIAKIPYPSLADKFVSAKLKISPEWYSRKTIIEVQQSVGRTVRNEEDWCITYILDACLGDLIHYNRKSFPAEFLKRIHTINE